MTEANAGELFGGKFKLTRNDPVDDSLQFFAGKNAGRNGNLYPRERDSAPFHVSQNRQRPPISV